MKKETKEKLISWLGAKLVRAIGCTLRIHVKDEAGFLSGEKGGPCLIAFWHNRLIILPELFKRHYGARKGVVALISQSRDGTFISNIVRRLGMRVVNGSSSRGGAAAALELINFVRGGFDAGITPDGPRGPRYHVDAGLIFLAQRTRAPILPVNAEYSRCIRFRSWDRFMVPLPFSRVDVTLG
ncbi:MAG TPA: lysophospholipid acyltransferase family protein, partial [Chthoniobacteraceae bacterium]|nr:lysophospholipid acyltransferase family protein [Chthoniobacteraceae bacterium]